MSVGLVIVDVSLASVVKSIVEAVVPVVLKSPCCSVNSADATTSGRISPVSASWRRPSGLLPPKSGNAKERLCLQEMATENEL